MRAAREEAVALARQARRRCTRAPSGGGGGVRAMRVEGKRSEQRKGEARVDRLRLNRYAGGYENRLVRKKIIFLVEMLPNM